MNRKILIADDDPVITKLLQTKLTENGYTVLAATDGITALKRIKKEKPGLIIADYMMPEMDGLTFYRNLKKDEETASIPVFILTSRVQVEESFRAMGLEVFLTKPFMMEGIISKVNQYMNAGGNIEEPANEFQEQSFKKVLVCGPIKYVVQDMVLQLQGAGCKTQWAISSVDALSKALEFNPDIILLDVAMGDVPAHKLITILRNMSKMINKVILVYNYLAQDGSRSVSTEETMGSEDYNSSVCMLAGATEFLGRFNPASFLNRMHRYLFSEN